MAVTDPIADLLTRIRNAIKASKRKVDVPSSRMKTDIVQILKEQRFISDFSIIEDNKQNILRIALKYSNGVSAINGLERISKPGLRQYKPSDEIPRVLNGLGIAIISTSKGVMTDKKAHQLSVGGEVICHIW